MRDENDRQYREPRDRHTPTPLQPEICRWHGEWMPLYHGDGDCPHCLDNYTPLNHPLPPIRTD